MELGLAGKRAIVTGGSAGIGMAIAARFVAEGIDTAVCSRSIERAEAAAKQLQGPGRVLAVELELRDPVSVNAMAELVSAQWGGIDILINSGADVSGNAPEDFAHITDEFILEAFETKFVGILRCCRAVVPGMREQGFGRIVNVAGHTAREAGSISAGARNSAVVNLTKALAMEVGRDGVTVNAIHPFTTVTERLDSRLTKMAERRGRDARTHLHTISEKTALGRLVTAEEIADFVAFLASPLSIALTGEVVALTGGVGHAVHG